MSTAEADEREQLVGVFTALGDPTRLGLIERLIERQPLSISRLATRSGITRQAVTKHLAVLDAAGLVASEKRGRKRFFRLQPDAIAPAQRYLERASSQWDAAVDRLRLHLADAE